MENAINELLDALRVARDALSRAKPIMSHYPETVESHNNAYRLACSVIAKHAKEESQK